MIKPQVDTPLVFTADLGDGTSEVAAIASSPFTLIFSISGIEPAEVASERNSDGRHVVATIVPNGTTVTVLQ
jgi:hypothetical protein